VHYGLPLSIFSRHINTCEVPMLEVFVKELSSLFACQLRPNSLFTFVAEQMNFFFIGYLFSPTGKEPCEQ
jgi:hypothetical protein